MPAELMSQRATDSSAVVESRSDGTPGMGIKTNRTPSVASGWQPRKEDSLFYQRGNTICKKSPAGSGLTPVAAIYRPPLHRCRDAAPGSDFFFSLSRGLGLRVSLLLAFYALTGRSLASA